MTAYATGRRYEQELVNRFLDNGWGALRLGASGGGGDADLPDVLAGRAADATLYSPNGNPYSEIATQSFAVELKSGKATTLYVDAVEVEALETFARTWGAAAFLGARSTRQGTPTETFLVRPGNARMTDGGLYGLPIDGIRDRAAFVVGDDGVLMGD